MKIDLHVHTSEVSRCGRLTAKEVVAIYKEAGYDAICITNHFSNYTLKWHNSMGKFDFIKNFEDGYQLAKAEGEKIGLRVFKGYEFRCNSADNDFLLYNVPDCVQNNIKDIFALSLKDSLAVLRANGVKIYQAHPFRPNTTMVDPNLIDGIEIYNGANGAGPINDMAKAWAAAHPHLRGISGSDCHQAHQAARGGIITDWDVQNEQQLIDCIQSGEYSIIEIH